MRVRWREDFDLSRRFSSLLPPGATQIAIALVRSALAIGTRLIVGLAYPQVVPFALVFPAIVVATLLAGARSGLFVIVLSQILVWAFVLPIQKSGSAASEDVVGLGLATLSECLLLWAVQGFRAAANRTAELERRRASELENSLREMCERVELQQRVSDHETSLRTARQHLDAIWGQAPTA